MGKLVLILLFLLLLSRSDGTAGAHATVNVLLLFLGWFQDLWEEEKSRLGTEKKEISNDENSITHLERAQQTLVHTHHCTGIIEFTTIVGCTE